MAFLRLFAVAAFAVVLTFAATGATRAGASSSSAEDIISLATPPFVQVGKRYAFTWSGGGPAQTYTIKSLRSDGWAIVEVADENMNLAYVVPGELPTRWLNIGRAISIQEMRAIQ
jgi:hypothetical protein